MFFQTFVNEGGKHKCCDIYEFVIVKKKTKILFYLKLK